MSFPQKKTCFTIFFFRNRGLRFWACIGPERDSGFWGCIGPERDSGPTRRERPRQHSSPTRWAPTARPLRPISEGLQRHRSRHDHRRAGPTRNRHHLRQPSLSLSLPLRHQNTVERDREREGREGRGSGVGEAARREREKGEMHSFGYRANALLTFALTILALMCAMASLSDNLSSPSASAEIQVGRSLVLSLVSSAPAFVCFRRFAFPRIWSSAGLSMSVPVDVRVWESLGGARVLSGTSCVVAALIGGRCSLWCCCPQLIRRKTCKMRDLYVERLDANVALQFDREI